jgi:hypothetical protein
MFKLATLAAVAVALVAGPATAGESIRISTAGKSAEQVKAEVWKAAAHVCQVETRSSLLAYYMQAPCIRAAIRDAAAQSGDPALLVATR